MDSSVYSFASPICFGDVKHLRQKSIEKGVEEKFDFLICLRCFATIKIFFFSIKLDCKEFFL